jgi:hypothetical protein
MILSRRFAAACLVLALVSAGGMLPWRQAISASWPTGDTGSWAVGLAVPEGAPLADGSRVAWESSGNITATVRLPAISETDQTIYAILTVMSGSGLIMQVAAGLYPGMESWRAYVLYTRAASQPVSYTWVVNDSAPTMAPGARISLAAYRGEGGWMYEVLNFDTGAKSSGAIAVDTSDHFAKGDQEAFALESYTSTPEVFASMGTMELIQLQLDGVTVTGGWYTMAGWNPEQSPLFLVGGYTPPSFAAVDSGGGTSMEWTYSEGVGGAYVSYSAGVFAEFVLAVILIVAAMLALDRIDKIRKKRKPTETSAS